MDFRRHATYTTSHSSRSPAHIQTLHMNRFDKFFGLKGEARIKYLDGEFQVLSPGEFVRCAVTGEHIALADLRYWSVELQEAYATATASLERYRRVKKV